MKEEGGTDMSTRRLETLKAAMPWTFCVLGALGSCLAFVNAVVFLFSVGVSGFLEKLLEYYREFFSPLHDLFHILEIPVDQIYLDAASLYIIGVVISFRLSKGIKQTEANFPQQLRHSRVQPFIPYNLYLIAKAISLRKNFDLAAYHGLRESELRARYYAFVKVLDQTLTSVALFPVGVLAFFVWNALA